MTNVDVVIKGRDASGRAFKSATRNIEGVGRVVGRVRGIVAGIGVALAGRQLLRGAGSVLAAFEKQEDAVEGLRASLIATGRDGAQSLDLLTQRAAELQRVTRAGDEAIIDATATLASLATGLNAAELARAQQALIGIADTFTRGDLNTAALLLGKTIGSTTNALTRYGIAVDSAGSQSEKLNQVIDATGAFFAISQAKAKTLSGQVAQLSNAWGDFKEALGATLGESRFITSLLERVKNLVVDLTAIVEAGTPFIESAFELMGSVAGNAYARGVSTAVADIVTKLRDAEFLGIPAIAPLIANPIIEFFNKNAAAATENINIAGAALSRLADSARNAAGATDPTARATTSGSVPGARPEIPGLTAVRQLIERIGAASRGPIALRGPGPIALPGQGLSLGTRQTDTPQLLRTLIPPELPAKLEETRDRAEQLAEAQAKAAAQTDFMAASITSSVSSFVSAAVAGTQQVEIAFLQMLQNIVNSIIERFSGGGLFGGVFGGIAGLGFGLLAGAFRDSSRPVAVRVAQIDPQAADVLADRLEGPERVTNVFVTARGQTPEDTRVLLDRLARRDGIPRHMSGTSR